ncbi:hypothetical protein DSM100688_1600 [Bifidobacterium ramosum]|uniref:DUF7724 domain-containing protein n=1 Tax=Bifidobacterium ramosum TaxID=1798158 RepID=A0A6L4WYY5_9BIFI|nr:hypothetical protein [Bifidobacterium ramosum]KAB8287513.1 hypothetical protein DSM100688_1600 [Bifidobacterium ramosum]NEG72233.1 hypothetical protein [Bifidobacterium ramosum]
MNATESATQQTNHTAYLSAENGFTVFEYGKTRIRFRAPYSLERYTNVKQWDNGYLVVDAKYRHNTAPEEEYIDLEPVLTDLYIDANHFLQPIQKVEIAHA